MAIEHPGWCDRDLCTVTDPGRPGFHWSRPAVLDPDPRTDISASVRIGQGNPLPRGFDRTVLVELALHFPQMDDTDIDDDPRFIMDGAHAVALGAMLRAAGRTAGGDLNSVASGGTVDGMARIARTTAPGNPGDVPR